MKPRGKDGCGYLTLAARHRMYLEMAVDLALSIRDTNLEPVSLVVDARLRDRAERCYHSVFEEILSLPDEYDFGRAFKYCVAEVTPYQRTLFIDADTLALGSLEETWKRLEGYRFAMIGKTLSPDDESLHHGRPIRYWCARFGLRQYFKTAGAVFFFEKRGGEAHSGRVFCRLPRPGVQPYPLGRGRDGLRDQGGPKPYRPLSGSRADPMGRAAARSGPVRSRGTAVHPPRRPAQTYHGPPPGFCGCAARTGRRSPRL